MSLTLRSPEEIRGDMPPFLYESLRSIAQESPHTVAHSLRIAELSRFAGSLVSRNPAVPRTLFIAGAGHDIGKSHFTELVDKKGRFTSEEREDVARHAELGAEMIEAETDNSVEDKPRSGFVVTRGMLVTASRVARYHHTDPSEVQLGEWNSDGSAGYIFVVRSFDELDASGDPDRPYKNGRPAISVLAGIERRIGLQFGRSIEFYRNLFRVCSPALYEAYNVRTIEGVVDSMRASEEVLVPVR